MPDAAPLGALPGAPAGAPGGITRVRAAAIHLAISVAIGAVVVSAMLLAWYPPMYLRAAGGGMLVLLLVGVDVLLGPLLTLVVFDRAKRHLVLDLAIIAGLQAAALAYGLGVMLQARPEYLVFDRDRFRLVAANEIDDAARAQASPRFRAPRWAGPEVVGLRAPTGPDAVQRMLITGFAGGDATQQPQFFIPYDDVMPVVAMKARPLAELREHDPTAAAAIDAAVGRSGAGPEALAWLPVRSRADAAAIVDARSGALVDLIPARPW